MEMSNDIQTIKELLDLAKIESIHLRKLTTTSFRIELVFSFEGETRMRERHE